MHAVDAYVLVLAAPLVLVLVCASASAAVMLVFVCASASTAAMLGAAPIVLVPPSHSSSSRETLCLFFCFSVTFMFHVYINIKIFIIIYYNGHSR